MKTGTITLLLFTALAGIIFLYARLVEPYAIEVRHCAISDPLLARAWGDIKIVQLSDLHITRPGRRERDTLEKLAKIAPDLIVITGDITQWRTRPENALRFIRKLKAPLGVYGVLGDADLAAGRYRCRFCHPRNDYHQTFTAPRLFRNQECRINLGANGKKLVLVGLGPASDRETRENFTKLVSALPADTPILVLCHFSGAWSRCSGCGRPLLWLSGDTHGGQVRLPSRVWKIFHIKPDPDHMAGLFHRPGRHQWLYVNRGLGVTEHFPLRLGVRPEITVFSFTSNSPAGKP